MEDHEEYFLRMLDICNSFIGAYRDLGHCRLIARFGASILEGFEEDFEETEDDLRYLTTTKAELVGKIVKPLDKERFIVKIDGHRYIVNCCSGVDQSKLVPGTRVTQTFTIMRILPPQVNPWVYPLVYKMIQTHHDDVSYSDLCGLSDQIEVFKTYIQLPLTNPAAIFQRVGIKPSKGVLLIRPPGTGKTMLAKAIASKTNSIFLMVFSNELLRLGDSPLIVREMFKYARDHQPCIIFMDEIDAIGRRRTIRETGSSLASKGDRVLMELFSQLDGLNELDQVKVIMATNRPDLLDSALIRPGRIDKKIEIPLPNESSRMRILQIHASRINKQGEIDLEKIVKLSEGFNGADMCNICTEAGMFAIRTERDYVDSNDFIKAATKIGEAKKLESNAQYNV